MFYKTLKPRVSRKKHYIQSETRTRVIRRESRRATGGESTQGAERVAIVEWARQSGPRVRVREEDDNGRDVAW